MKLAELKALRDGITKGEWRKTRTLAGFDEVVVEEEADYTNWPTLARLTSLKEADANAKLISYSPNILSLAISLLEEKEGLRGKIEGMKKEGVENDKLGQWGRDGYNSAIDEVLALLEDKEK